MSSSISPEALNEFLNMVRNVFTLTIAVQSKDSVLSLAAFDGFLKNAMTLLETRSSEVDEESMDTPSIVIHKGTTSNIIPNVIVVKDDDDEVAAKPAAAAKNEKEVRVEFVPKQAEARPRKLPTLVVADTADEEEGEVVEEAEEEVEEAEAEAEAEAEEEVEEAEAEAEEEVEEAEAEEEVEEAEAEAEEEVEEAEEAVEEEVEEVEEEVEEEEAEEEGLVEVKIGKKLYFIEESSQLVYARISAEEPGDCLGRLQNGKIVPQ